MESVSRRGGGYNAKCFDFEPVATSEINIFAIISFAAIHHGLTDEMVKNYHDYPSLAEIKQYLREKHIGYDPDKKKEYNWDKNIRMVQKVWLACQLNHNLGDVSRINELPEADIWFCSFPCTDLSIAGRLRGMNPDDETRSSLIWHTVRLLKWATENNKAPSFMILENVKNLVGKRFKSDFDALNAIIGEYGYNVYYNVLNAKNCGVPQNRERVFAVYIRKDIDNGKFKFPLPFDTGIRAKDILEDENTVDDHFYIRNERARTLIEKLVVDGNVFIGEERERERDGGPLHEKSEKEGLCELYQSREPWDRESRSFGYGSSFQKNEGE